MAQMEDFAAARGGTLVDRSGDKIGKIDDIYEDTSTGRPEWALVNTGLFGSKSTFVPLQGADRDGDDVRVQYEKAQVKDAPSIDADGALSAEEEQGLYRHYGLDYDSGDTGSGHGDGVGTTGGVDSDRDRTDRDHDGDRDTVGHDTSGPTTDDAMTRSEEELRVGTASRETGRARLRKYVVTENVTQTVPVQREEVRVEREPITDANRGDAGSGPDISEEEHEVTLHAEEPVVDKRTVAKERVRMDKDTVTDEQTVSEDVRKEQIDTDDADEARR